MDHQKLNQDIYKGTYTSSVYEPSDWQTQYGITPPAQPSEKNAEEPVSVGEWLASLILMLIPVVGLVLIFVWAFGGSEKKSKSNFFKAQLIFAIINIGLVIFAVVAAFFLLLPVMTAL